MRIFTLSSNSKFRKISQTLSLALGLMLMAVVANAQIEQTWIGATSNNFIVEDNWDPAGSPIGNNIFIPLPDTANGVSTPAAIEVTGSENISVNYLEVFPATDMSLQPTVTINLESNDVTFTVVTGNEKNCDYGYTGIIVQQGHYYFTKGNGPRLDYQRSYSKSRRWYCRILKPLNG